MEMMFGRPTTLVQTQYLNSYWTDCTDIYIPFRMNCNNADVPLLQMSKILFLMNTCKI